METPDTPKNEAAPEISDQQLDQVAGGFSFDPPVDGTRHIVIVDPPSGDQVKVRFPGSMAP